MESLTTCVPCLLMILLIFSDTQVGAQEGPGIVIAHPGQDVELLCTVTVTSGSQITGWLVNIMGPYRITALRSGILTGHSATVDSNNLIVENITTKDVRNGSKYRCVIVPAQGMLTVTDIINESDPAILYVAATGVVMITTTISETNTTIATSSVTTITTTNTAATTTTTTNTATTTTNTATTTTNTAATTTTNTSSSGDGSGDGSTIIIIVVIVILILLYCCLVFLFFYCYKRKERDYQDKDFCDEPKRLLRFIILGVFTFGISILVWYIYVKYKDNDEDDNEYCRIVHVSIIVLGIYTFGTSLLLWWLHKKLAGLLCENDSEGPKGIKFFFDTEASTSVTPYAVSPQALGEGKHATKTEALKYDYAKTGPISLVVPGANNNQQFAPAKPERRSSVPQQTAAVDRSTEADKRSSVPHMITASGLQYAVSDKASVKDNHASSDTMEDQGIRYADLQLSNCVNAVSENPSIQYTEVL